MSPADSVSIEWLSAIVAQQCLHRGRLIIHIAKECSPVVSFGGVGQFLGELAEAQAKYMEDDCIVVIMPKYRFEEKSRLTAEYKYRFKGQNVVGNIFYRYRSGISHIMIGAPSCYPRLWLGMREETAYDRPNGMQKEDRDLFFGFIAAEVVRLLKSMQSEETPSAVVHAHGATNVPILGFLRTTQDEGKFILVYTVHDYNSEQNLKYTADKIAEYLSHRGHYTSHRCTPETLSLFACSLSGVKSREDPGCLGRIRLGPEYFASCADAISTVSAGMIKHVMEISDGYTELLLRYRSQQRLWPILNWVTESLWREARRLVPSGSTIEMKAEAKRRLFALFPEFGIGHLSLRSEDACVIGWVGRFEPNKGALLLPDILEASCESRCVLVIAGHITSKHSRKMLETQKKKLHEISEKKDCPVMLIADKVQQDKYSGIIRASQDIVIVPSTSEAYGLVAAESLAFASIPVVSQVGGLPEIVSPYNGMNNFVWTGFTFPHFDSIALTRLSLRITLLTATEVLFQSRVSGNLSLLHDRLILSTPLRNSSAGGLQKYISLYGNYN